MDFKEYERLHPAQDAEVQEVGEVQEVIEVQEVSEVKETEEVQEDSETLTPKAIAKAGKNLQQTAYNLTKLAEPDASEEDAVNFAHTPFYKDYLAGTRYAIKRGSLRPDLQAIADELKRAADKAQSALDEWQEIREQFFTSNTWGKMKEAFPKITPAQGEILLNTPDFLWQVVKELPEILQEIKQHEQTTKKKLKFADLLMQAGDLEDASDPREMVLSVFLARIKARKRRFADDVKKSNELSKYHVIPNTPLSKAIRNGVVGQGEQHILASHGRGKKKKEVTITAQLYFDFSSGNPKIVDPAEEIKKEPKTENAYMIAAGAAGNITIYANDTPFDAEVRYAVYTKIFKAKIESRDWSRVYFTPTSLYQDMRFTDKEPSEEMKQKIAESLEKQMFLRGHIDLTNDFEMRGISFYNPNTDTYESNVKINGILCELERIDIGKGRDMYSVYRPGKYPLELAYAEQTGQMITYQADLLDVKEVDSKGRITDVSISNTEGRILISNYIIRTVFDMKYQLEKARENWRKNETYRQKRIASKQIDEDMQLKKELRDYLPPAYKDHFRMLFDTMFRKVELNSTNRKTLQRQRDYAFDVMKFLKAKKVIKNSYQVGKRPIIGIDIEF